MRKIVLVSILTSAFCAPGVAEQSITPLPEILIGGEASARGTSETCVDVEIGDGRAYNCLNQKLKRQVDRVNPNLNLPPVDARSSDIRVGVVNMPAVQQQYGRNFGISVIPFRPALPAYASPVGPR